MNKDIQQYNNKQSATDKKICNLIAKEICSGLPKAENKIWHAHPVWFIDGNPIVGYSKLKNCIRLLFWSGQSFEEPELVNEGSFKAAEMRYTSVHEIDVKKIQKWLKKAALIQWDYKNLIKRKGVLLKSATIPVTTKSSPYGTKKFVTIDEYHAAFPANVQLILEQLRKAIKQAAPDSQETISYNMPAFNHHKNLVYYAAYKNHIGFYPTPSPLIVFKEELAGYKTSKGAIQFPLDKPLPITLIKKIVKYRISSVKKAM